MPKRSQKAVTSSSLPSPGKRLAHSSARRSKTITIAALVLRPMRFCSAMRGRLCHSHRLGSSSSLSISLRLGLAPLPPPPLLVLPPPPPPSPPVPPPVPPPSPPPPTLPSDASPAAAPAPAGTSSLPTPSPMPKDSELFSLPSFDVEPRLPAGALLSLPLGVCKPYSRRTLSLSIAYLPVVRTSSLATFLMMSIRYFFSVSLKEGNFAWKCLVSWLRTTPSGPLVQPHHHFTLAHHHLRRLRLLRLRAGSFLIRLRHRQLRDAAVRL
mmetsp:Transcript_19382/g.55844  ORF Transcript_19382/g.55844 Transcript_19382/m.55844 type:complete len:267 (-) Transcript_19382:32-832(-)